MSCTKLAPEVRTFIEPGRAARIAVDGAAARLSAMLCSLLPLEGDEAVDACVVAARAVHHGVDFAIQQAATTPALRSRDANDVAEKAVAAMRVAKKKVAGAIADARGPATLSARAADLSVEDFAKIAALRAEIGSVAPARIREWWLDYVRSGAEGKERDLALAAGPVLESIVRGGVAGLAERLGKPKPKGGCCPLLEKELAAAIRLRSEIACRREALVPEATRVAVDAHAELESIFAIVFGHHPSILSRDELDARFGCGAGIGEASALDVHPAWLARWRSRQARPSLATARAPVQDVAQDVDRN